MKIKLWNDSKKIQLSKKIYLVKKLIMSKTYIQENDGFITASKLKCFLRNPQEYYLQYVKKVDLETEEEKRCFVV